MRIGIIIIIAGIISIVTLWTKLSKIARTSTIYPIEKMVSMNRGGIGCI